MIRQCKVKLIRADLSKCSLNPEYELKERKDFFENGLKLAADWIVSGQLKPYINQTVTLEQVEETLANLKKRQTGFGKIVAKIH
jgi:NADPH:quinone reductase-like Zn-dependent oxidoreductase